MDLQVFLTILLWLMIGSATAYYAKRRGRDPLLWFMIGMLLGILGLVLLFILPIVKSELENNSEMGVKIVDNEIDPSSSTETLNNYLIHDWYYYDREQNRQGPMRYEMLKTLWQTGILNENSFVWMEGMEEWKKIEELPSLYAHLVLQDEKST